MISVFEHPYIAVYSLLSFAPTIFLAVWPFRKHLRFSLGVTKILIAVLCVMQIMTSVLVASNLFGEHIIYLIRTALYSLFYLLIIKNDLSKLIFTLISLSNVGNLVSVCARFAESHLFGDSTVDVYSWDLCFWIIVMHLAVTLPLYFYISKSYSSIVNTPLSIWGYLCSIPIIFYMIWFFYLYLSDKNSLQVAQDIQSTIYLVMINLSAFIIYHVAILLIKEKKKAQELIQQNNLLTVQKIQYDNLQNRINEARRARHDLRHHIHMIQEYLHGGKLQELEAYLADYTETLPDSPSLVYCQHYATNAILDFFANRAKENGIETDIFVQLPEKINIPETTISVVLGNLLENALEACYSMTEGERKITVRGKLEMNAVFFDISNTYQGKISRNKSGKMLSTKAEDRGLGLESVSHLAQSLGGVMETNAEDGNFRVSVLLPEQPENS